MRAGAIGIYNTEVAGSENHRSPLRKMQCLFAGATVPDERLVNWLEDSVTVMLRNQLLDEGPDEGGCSPDRRGYDHEPSGCPAATVSCSCLARRALSDCS
jgi:hypothetical protein